MKQGAHRPRLLLVDDVPDNLAILGDVLKDYQRVVATSGEKGLEKAFADPRPDLVLLDVMMPGMSGYDVCRRLKEDPRTADIPVIFVTALGEVSDEAAGFDVGGVDYITKPVSPATVLARVRTHLSLKAAREDLAEHNLVLEDRVAARTRELQEAYSRLKKASSETVWRLSTAAEYRDDDTGAHVKRMSHYSATVGRQMGMTEEAVDMLLQASPMHDVGKIGIPDRILLKPGKLDDEEWAIMRRHCKMGADILAGSDSSVLQMAEAVALCHHEKWDGSGYPRRLGGTDIPLVGRVVAIADVFDALTSVRPYKGAFPLEKAYSIIREGRGGHFDPDVVDAFFDVQEEVLAIKARFHDSRPSHLQVVARTNEGETGA